MHIFGNQACACVPRLVPSMGRAFSFVAHRELASATAADRLKKRGQMVEIDSRLAVGGQHSTLETWSGRL